MLDRYIKTKEFTYLYSAFLFAYAVFFMINGWDGYSFDLVRVKVNGLMYVGIEGLVLITSAMLILSSRLSDAMLPAMMISVISLACYDSADQFLSLGFLWVVPFALFAVIFHFIRYAKPMKVGKSFWGLCAVSVAVTLGGLGSIAPSDYFGGTSLFYVFGLGVGMVAFYLLIKTQMDESEKLRTLEMLRYQLDEIDGIDYRLHRIPGVAPVDRKEAAFPDDPAVEEHVEVLRLGDEREVILPVNIPRYDRIEIAPVVAHQKEPSRRYLLKSRRVYLKAEDPTCYPRGAVQQPAVEPAVVVVCHDLLADEHRRDEPDGKIDHYHSQDCE